MGSEHDLFFDGLKPHLSREGFSNGRPNPSARDIYSARRGTVKVTVNYAPTQDRLSIKLTMSRGKPGGPTSLYDALRERHQGDQASLTGAVEWMSPHDKTESKVQVTYPKSASATPTAYSWVMENAKVLRSWADELRDL
jgi:hypothetical protein